MTNTGDSSDYDAERFAGLVFAHREAILDSWCELARVDDAEPASDFIRSQLDASILALANWLLGIDPADSTMGRQWAEITPSSEMTVGAVVSMSLLPCALKSATETLPEPERAVMTQKASEFVGMMTHRLLAWVNVEFDDDRWDQIARDVEEKYERQRLLRVRRLGVLIEIAHAVSTGQDLDSLFEQVQRSIIQLSGSDYAEISLLDYAAGKLRCHLVYANGARQSSLEQTLIEQGLANEVLKTGASLVVSDYASACAERGIPPSQALSPTTQRAWMGAPMRLGGDVVGIIAVSGRLTSYETEDVELLSAIARQTAVALANRRLIEAQRRHVAQLSTVNHLAREIAHLRDARDLMRIAAERIQESFEFGLVTVFQSSSDEGRLIMQARSPVPVEDEERDARIIRVSSGSVVGDVAIRRTAALHCDVRRIDSYFATESTASTRSEMAVPIIHSGKLLGVLDVQSDRTGAFDEHDLTTLQTIADQLAIGLENSRLFADEASRTRELRLMLETTRAASSSLLLDQVLERLAEGLASAAQTQDCLIHLFDPDEKTFVPSAYFQTSPSESSALFNNWNQILRLDDRPDLEALLSDPFPQLICELRAPNGEPSDPLPTFVVPLRSRQRTLGIAIVALSSRASSCYPLEQMRLLQGIADSAALAIENARLYTRAHGLAIAEERGRLAQEIHDTLAQGLTAISLQLDLADSYLPDNPQKASKNVTRALDLTRENLNQARRSVLDLRAADVHEMSLPDAITQLLRRLSDESSISCEFVNNGLTSRLSARVEVGLYRIIEEAIENARRHSNARQVHVDIEADGQTVAVLVEDDGEGFDPSAPPRGDGSEQGFGLLGIRERARLLGGSLRLSSTPGVGARLQVVVPYEARMSATSGQIQQQGEQL